MLTFEEMVQEEFIARLIAEGGGQAPGKLEVDSITLDMATAYAEAIMEKNKRTLDGELPEFDQNFVFAQRATRVGKTRRKDMPVINDNQVREFQAELKTGKVDINKPLAPSTSPSNPWPEGLSGKEAEEFIVAGLHDGDKKDDKIKVTSVKVSAKDLRPIQRQIYFDKSIGATAQFGAPATRSFLQKSLMIMSADNFIIDGHHRWLSALLVDPKLQLPGIKIGLPISQLLPVSLAYGDALGNQRNQ